MNASNILFSFAILYTLSIWYLILRKELQKFFVLLIWTILQLALSYAGFYLDENGIPPRMMLTVGPPLVLIIYASLRIPTEKVEKALPQLMWIHLVRLPVEMVLYMMHQAGKIPEGMTFSGGNWDILSGLSAPVIYYLYQKGMTKPKVLMLWNLICLTLLLKVVFIGIFSLPTPLQLMNYDQPNVGLMHFPYPLLPALIVPSVLLSHLIWIRYLWKKIKIYT